MLEDAPCLGEHSRGLVVLGDPLFALDPIYQSIVDPRARARLVATYDHDVSEHEWCTGYRWDIVLTGSHRTPREEDRP